MILADTHCHLDFPAFDPDREAVLDRARSAGLTRILVPALTVASAAGVIRLAGTCPELYAAVGVHPTEAAGWDERSSRALTDLVRQGGGKVVAIGEVGLDYYWERASHEQQRSVLAEQLQLAGRLGLPVILHLREARSSDGEPCAADLLALLEDWLAEQQSGGHCLHRPPGVLHSFSGSLATARAAVALGFLIGVTGPITFRNAPDRAEVVRSLPLSSLLLETDAPFLTPHPHRGRRNEPAFVAQIADKIALLHGCSPEEVARVTSASARQLFGWDAC